MTTANSFIDGKVLSGRVYPKFFAFDTSHHVLNIGCGYGPQAIAYAGHYEQMIGIDITHTRLVQSLKLRQTAPMGNYIPLMGDVEVLPFNDATFDRAIAIDIIEHVQSPEKMCHEIRRVLKDNGQVLVTFPTMHDKYTALVSWIARNILRRQSKGTFHDSSSEWHPDHHNQEYPINDWIALVESYGFRAIRSRATTLFPPLHLYGVPRFWFSNDAIHSIDSWLSQQALLKNYGQGLMVVFEAI